MAKVVGPSARRPLYLRGRVIDPSQLSRYDLVAAALQAVLVVVALATAGVYVAKRSGNRSSNVFFALLLVTFALSIATLVLEHLAIPARFPRWRYVPLWFTWTFGPAWFYYVKFSLFPAYRFRPTDLKHFVLPLAQVFTYAAAFARGEDGFAERLLLGLPLRTYEELVFVVSVGGYLLGGYRYLRYRAREIGAAPLRWDYWKVRLLRRAQRVIVVLLTFNFAFVVYNFMQTQLAGEGLLHVRSFYASSSLSFGLILLYLVRGVAYRQHFYPQVPPVVLSQKHATPEERFAELVERQGGFRDPDLHRVRVARAVGVAPEQLDRLAQGVGASGWWALIVRLRVREIARLRAAGASLRQAALRAGFASRRHALSALRGRGQ